MHFHYELNSEVRLLNLLEKHVTATEYVSRTLEAHNKILEVQDRQTDAMAARLAALEKQANDGSS